MAIFNLFIALLIALACQQQAGAANETDVPRAIRIPVFYLADRNRIDNDKNQDAVEFGNERQYKGADKNDPYLGVAYCVIKNIEKKKKDPSWDALGWTESSRLEEGPDGTALTPGKDYAEIESNFYDSVYKRGVANSQHELDLFIPGYMSTFDSGLRSAARLSYYANRPALLYSWPSKGKFSEYISDLGNVEWSQEHFNHLIQQLGASASQDPPLRVRLYAHSMGNKLVLRATPVLKSCPTLTEVSMICPDVDNGVVYQYAHRYFDTRGRIVIRLYESKHDRMLKLSQFAHGGYKQFGEDHQSFDTMLPNGTPIGLPPGSIGDLPPTEKIDKQYSILRRIQTLDFTDIDVGALGHRIPVEALAGLSETGTPGGGLELLLNKAKKSADNELPAEAPVVGGPGDGVVKIMRVKRPLPIIGTISRNRPRMRLLLTKDWSLK